MREIKFRSQDMNTKELLYFDDYKFQSKTIPGNCSGVIRRYILIRTRDNSWNFTDHWCEVNTLQLFTGFKDKNGKEIYGGDIVIDVNEKDINVNVRMEEGAWYPFWNKDNVLDERMRFGEGREVQLYLFEDLDDVEVIGNIYENPELIEVDDENNKKV